MYSTLVIKNHWENLFVINRVCCNQEKLITLEENLTCDNFNFLLLAGNQECNNESVTVIICLMESSKNCFILDTTSVSSTFSLSTASVRSCLDGWRRSSIVPPITARPRPKFTPNGSSTLLKHTWNRGIQLKIICNLTIVIPLKIICNLKTGI